MTLRYSHITGRWYATQQTKRGHFIEKGCCMPDALYNCLVLVRGNNH